MKKVKKIHPIDGVISTANTIVNGTETFRAEALNHEEEGWVVDTVEAFDTRRWETGIQRKEESWIIVEQYSNKEKAVKGHKQWVEKMKVNSARKLKDINVWGL